MKPWSFAQKEKIKTKLYNFLEKEVTQIPHSRLLSIPFKRTQPDAQLGYLVPMLNRVTSYSSVRKVCNAFRAKMCAIRSRICGQRSRVWMEFPSKMFLPAHFSFFEYFHVNFHMFVCLLIGHNLYFSPTPKRISVIHIVDVCTNSLAPIMGPDNISQLEPNGGSTIIILKCKGRYAELLSNIISPCFY